MGSWNIAKATTPYLIKAASKDKSTGRIIFVGSTGQYTGRALNTHASIAKAGVDALSAQLAIELGPRGVTSNVIAPGPIADTEGVKRLIESSVTANKLKEIPLGTLGGVEDIANATVFLFSGAGKYVNGHVLVGKYGFSTNTNWNAFADCRSRWWCVENRRWSNWNWVPIPGLSTVRQTGRAQQVQRTRQALSSQAISFNKESHEVSFRVD